jgi:hypothetical protein
VLSFSSSFGFSSAKSGTRCSKSTEGPATGGC